MDLSISTSTPVLSGIGALAVYEAWYRPAVPHAAADPRSATGVPPCGTGVTRALDAMLRSGYDGVRGFVGVLFVELDRSALRSSGCG